MLRRFRWLVGVAMLAVSVAYLTTHIDGRVLGRVRDAAAGSPGPLAVALGLYAAAFGLRTWAWCRVLPGLSAGQGWAALHVSLLGNHVLPLRLGEVLRVTSVLRRTALSPRDVTATAVTLRATDLLAVLVLAGFGAPALFGDGWTVTVGVALVTVGTVALWWLRSLRSRGAMVRLPGPGVLAASAVAWLLEAAVMWTAAAAVGLPLGYPAAIAVTAATIAAQTVAITPGGIGSYEAAATAALVGLGAAPGPALAVALLAHGLKTAYSLVVGGVAVVVPAPSYLGRLRLPPVPPRPATWLVGDADPVVVLIPAYDEGGAIGAVLAALPTEVAGRAVHVLVVDDGSTDDTAEAARAGGATLIGHRRNLGLGAAVRTGLAAASELRPACVVYLDADGEYPASDVAAVAVPVLDGTADYVVGSRFAGRDRRMRRHRLIGNLLLTQWVRVMARRRDITDGQSGMRAFSTRAAAEAEIVHDYNYAQVLTLDLLGKGFAYTEVPIDYHFRTAGRSFVRLLPYLRHVLPAVHRQLNPAMSRGVIPRPRVAAPPLGSSVGDAVSRRRRGPEASPSHAARPGSGDDPSTR